MDEPTAALSPKEIEELYELVDSLKAQGKAILFISHKFDEIFRIADRYTVLSRRPAAGQRRIADVTEAELVRMMVGRDVEPDLPQA
jgi:rhamnose transport system ATP-binding protein